ncbi:MAG TPA: LemA family protein [Candidatus Omnitrophota bacterium]|nr:LemA family protein [Candidatus Omnitrophota bacterium]HPD85611.1 LemA family protein [Candidatus Omnitrophota bacterium]HRZ04454.1 LemA family protein [Candidatus Omnitrophota bacterium]
MTMTLVIILGVIVFLALWFVGVYNRIIGLKQNVENGWSQIDVQLKRRHDLIPNLIEVAKGYIAHERGTLEAVVKARQQAVDASGLKDKQQAENFLSQTLRSLFAVVENYPNLKADQHMLKLQEELTSTENKIAFARQYYNDEAARFNTTVQTIPNNIVAGMAGFKSYEFFEIEDKAQKEPPAVKF